MKIINGVTKLPLKLFKWAEMLKKSLLRSRTETLGLCRLCTEQVNGK